MYSVLRTPNFTHRIFRRSSFITYRSSLAMLAPIHNPNSPLLIFSLRAGAWLRKSYIRNPNFYISPVRLPSHFCPLRGITATHTGHSTCFQKTANRRLTHATNQPSSVSLPPENPRIFQGALSPTTTQNQPNFATEKKSPVFTPKQLHPATKNHRNYFPCTL